MSEQEAHLYDTFGADYDIMVDWHGRLEWELPCILKLLPEPECGEILDVGSATGYHARALADHGYTVVGLDPSEVMVERARALTAGGVDVSFLVGGLGAVSGAVSGRQFAAALCLGNTLPHLPSLQALNQAFADLGAALQSGAALVIQQLNYDRIMRHRQRFLGQTVVQRDDEVHIFFRFYDFGEDRLSFNVLIQQKDAAGNWHWRIGNTELTPFTAEQVMAALEENGFRVTQLLGSYGGEVFSAELSNDLVLVAEKLG